MNDRDAGAGSVFVFILRLLLTIIATLVIFTLALGGIVFRCLYPEGGRRLAASLLQYPVVSVLPSLYYSHAEMLEIRALNAYSAADPGGSAAKVDIPDIANDLKLAEGTAGGSASPSGGVLLVDGLAVVPAPTPEPTPEPVPAEEEQPEPTVQYGLVLGNVSAILRSSPSLTGKKVAAIPPGTWCRVLEKEGMFFRISYEGEECYIHEDKLEIREVPDDVSISLND